MVLTSTCVMLNPCWRCLPPLELLRVGLHIQVELDFCNEPFRTAHVRRRHRNGASDTSACEVERTAAAADCSERFSIRHASHPRQLSRSLSLTRALARALVPSTSHTTFPFCNVQSVKSSGNFSRNFSSMFDCLTKINLETVSCACTCVRACASV